MDPALRLRIEGALHKVKYENSIMGIKMDLTPLARQAVLQAVEEQIDEYEKSINNPQDQG